jgi:hypothetical protein
VAASSDGGVEGRRRSHGGMDMRGGMEEKG